MSIGRILKQLEYTKAKYGFIKINIIDYSIKLIDYYNRMVTLSADYGFLKVSFSDLEELEIEYYYDGRLNPPNSDSFINRFIELLSTSDVISIGSNSPVSYTYINEPHNIITNNNDMYTVNELLDIERLEIFKTQICRIFW